MSEEEIKTLKIIATFFQLIPIGVGIINYKAEIKFRLFLLFFIYGFLTDILVWQLYPVHEKISFILFITYTLLEALFFIYFINALSQNLTLGKFQKYLAGFIIILWLFTHCKFQSISFESNKLSAVFDTTYSIIISLISVMSILRIIENDQDYIYRADYWFLIGTFFYFFSTFFLTAFNETELLNRIWWIHSLVSISSSLIYAKAFSLARRKSYK